MFALLGSSLYDGLKHAIEMHQVHQQLFDEFTATFPVKTVAGWEKMVMEWESDMTKSNPYEEPAIGKYLSRVIICVILFHFIDTFGVVTTSADVKLELVKEEEEDALCGCQVNHEISPTLCLTLGLDLEESQYIQ